MGRRCRQPDTCWAEGCVGNEVYCEKQETTRPPARGPEASLSAGLLVLGPELLEAGDEGFQDVEAALPELGVVEVGADHGH